MTYVIDHDSIQSTDAGYEYSQGEEVTIALGVLVSSTQKVGVYSGFANSRLVNHGHVISVATVDDTGIGVYFSQNDGSIVNGAGASISGYLAGIGFAGSRPAVTNYGTIEGLQAIFGIGIFYSASLSPSDAQLTIVNGVGGVIAGNYAAIIAAGITSGRVSIDNRGTIDGHIVMLFSDSNDVVINRGIVNGTVHLDRGNDVFNGLGGRSGSVHGGDGNDTLVGGGRADWLYGGGDKDVLTGRGGADRFVFDTKLDAATNTDRITDFTVNVDKIALGKDAQDQFAAVGPYGVLGAARFHVGAAAADASDRIIYNPNTGFLYYDEDGRGGDPQVRFAQLAKHLALDHADFLIVIPSG